MKLIKHSVWHHEPIAATLNLKAMVYAHIDAWNGVYDRIYDQFVDSYIIP